MRVLLLSGCAVMSEGIGVQAVNPRTSLDFRIASKFACGMFSI